MAVRNDVARGRFCLRLILIPSNGHILPRESIQHARGHHYHSISCSCLLQTEAVTRRCCILMYVLNRYPAQLLKPVFLRTMEGERGRVTVLRKVEVDKGGGGTNSLFMFFLCNSFSPLDPPFSLTLINTTTTAAGRLQHQRQRVQLVRGVVRSRAINENPFYIIHYPAQTE